MVDPSQRHSQATRLFASATNITIDSGACTSKKRDDVDSGTTASCDRKIVAESKYTCAGSTMIYLVEGVKKATSRIKSTIGMNNKRE